MKTIIRKATEQDVEIIAKLAIQMWETHSIEELAQDFYDEINQKSSAIFLAFVDNFAKVSVSGRFGAGNNSDVRWYAWQYSFSLGCKQPFGFKLGF